ncbi:MAG TPA: methyltransferase domain-containing protein [Pyrinomonadaceae bacterium]|jgi:SAM-dependent methyltransferase
MNDKEKTVNEPPGWDERYRSGKYSSAQPHKLLISLVEKLKPGKALDLACGTGRHAIFLAENGWRVTAVDNSAVGIEIAGQRAAEKRLEIDFRVADLEKDEFRIEADTYDLICDFYYLQRELFDAMKSGVKHGGLIVSTIHIYGAGEKPGRFLLREGELKEFFAGFEILHYHETPQTDTDAGEHHRRTAEIIARKTVVGGQLNEIFSDY